MLSLLELVSQNQPHFQTHKALLVIGLQNDFILPDGKLPVSTHTGFLDRIHALIPSFRAQSPNVVWIQTLYDADRPAQDAPAGEGDAVVAGGLVDGADSSTDEDDLLPTATASRSSKHKQRALDLLKRVSARRRAGPSSGTATAARAEGADADANDDDELFLRPAGRTAPACVPDTPGADFVESIRPEIGLNDTVVRTTHYSAFQGTSLLLVLRARLVTELYICGCITNVSVLATVVDAARHGIRINVVQDCLGFRKQARHDVALRRMVDFFDANLVTSSEVMARPAGAAGDGRGEGASASNEAGGDLNVDDNDGDVHGDDGLDDEGQKRAGLEGLVGKMRLSEARPRPPRPQPPPNGLQRAPSAASAADELFADALTRGAPPDAARSAQPAPTAKQGLVKSKIRMRSRADKGSKDKDDDKKARAESSKKGAQKGASSSTPPPAKHTQEQASAAASPPADSPRPPSVIKAGSIDKLRDASARSDRPLKSSASHPVLSSAHNDTKERPSTSRLRLGLSRSSKSDLGKDAVRPAQTPPKSATAAAAPGPAVTTETPTMGKPSKLPSLANLPVLGPGDCIAEGDSRVVYDFFPPDFHHPSEPSKPLRELIFSQLYNEVRWQKMMHQQGEVPRLVCCQGEFSADGSMPVYRHPADQTLPLLHFSPKVQIIRKRAEELVGHPLNHVLIQLYRSGNDYISEHSDKTLDIVRGSSIVNVSFGAQRTMRLRTKKPESAGDSDEGPQRETQRVAMPHNSMFVLGLKSNEKWLHGIMADKRLPVERSPEETAYSGIRISLTFRHIGTFLDARNSVIWGQGATTKDQRDACDVINDDDEETERIVRAFSRENHSADFDWEEWYGDGFDVLHLHAPPKDLPIVFESRNTVEVEMIKIFLTEQKIDHIVCEAPALDPLYEVDRQVSYRDNDVNHTEILYAMPTVLYLDRYYPFDTDDRGRYCTSQSYDLFIQISAMMKFWHNRQVPSYLESALNMLSMLEERIAFGPGPFIAGRRFSIGDCGTWPALDELITNYDGWTEERYPKLTAYYKMLWKKKKSVQTLRAELPRIKKSSKEPVKEARDGEQDL